MPFIAVPQTTQVIIRYSNASNLYENVIHYKWSTTTPPTTGELTSLCNAVIAGVAAKLRDCVSNGWNFREVSATNISSDPGNTATVAFPSGTTGNAVGSQVAASEACRLVKRTGLSGHGQHGGFAVSGFTEGAVDGNSIGSGLMGQLAALATELLVSYVTARFIPALAHKHPHAPLATSSTPITFVGALDNNIDSQKTRLNSHGR